MKLIVILIALFLLGCVLWGIQAGVAAIARGIARFGQHRPDEPDTSATPPMLPRPDQAQPASAQTDPPAHWTAQLRTLFTLHQQGALTRDEFEQAKRRLLDTTSDSSAASRLSYPPLHPLQRPS